MVHAACCCSPEDKTPKMLVSSTWRTYIAYSHVDVLLCVVFPLTGDRISSDRCRFHWTSTGLL